MNLSYPLNEWPILSCIGMFMFLIIGLLYGQLVTAKLPLAGSTAERRDTDHQT